MARKLSCREAVYPTWQDALQRLPHAGIRCIEAQMRSFEELRHIVNAARDQGMAIATLAGWVDLSSRESMQTYHAALYAAGRLGIPIFFTSAYGDDGERHYCMARLAELADEAERMGVVLSLETHPPFCHNAEEMSATLQAVGRPNLRINFDTANILYYNRALNSADELERVVDYVASVHLKDSDGGFNSHDFPVLGQGVVEWQRIFRTLDAAGFDGPLTIELEGPVVAGKDADQRHAAVVACMDYLHSIGVLETA